MGIKVEINLRLNADMKSADLTEFQKYYYFFLARCIVGSFVVIFIKHILCIHFAAF